MARNDGFTLIEVTVLVTAIGLLVGLFASSAGDLLHDSRVIRAREDVEEIGAAIAEFYADNDFFPRTEDVVNGRPGKQVVGVLIGDAPLAGSTEAGVWWVRSRLDLLGAHLATNVRGYSGRDPAGRRGWNGPYLNAALREDPWGHAYMANVFYLDPRPVVQEIDGTPLGAVFVLCAGPNGIIETPFYQPRGNAAVYGDDIGFRLQ